MKYTIEIRDKAIEEMDLSKEYYHEKRVGLGDEFIKKTSIALSSFRQEISTSKD